MSTISSMVNSAYRFNDYAMNHQNTRKATDLLEKPVKEDPAGVSIASKEEAQMRGDAMRARNRQSEIDMANISDGGRAGISDYLQDMNTYSIQAANGTNSESDIRAIRNAQNQLAAGIDQMGKVTKYNETNPISGTSTRNLGVTQNFNTDEIGDALQKVNADRAKVGAETNGNEAAVRNLNNVEENTMAAYNRTMALE